MVMRYAKNTVVVQAERDIPLLRQVRNSKFVSHIQLFELMRFGGWESSRDSFNWRVRRLLKAKFPFGLRRNLWRRFSSLPD